MVFLKGFIGLCKGGIRAVSGESLTGRRELLLRCLRSSWRRPWRLKWLLIWPHEEKGSGAGNKRNGKDQKTVKGQHGEITISTPQDRHSTFEPEIVEKCQRILADNLDRKIIGIYGLGTSLRDISANIEEMYDSKISTHVLSDIRDRIIPKLKQWQGRPLEPVNHNGWLYAMHFKVREEGKVKIKALYNILGIN